MKKLSLLVVSLTPALMFAADKVNTGKGLSGSLKTISDLLSTVAALLFALAVLFFFYGMVKYILKAGEEKAEGLNMMIWGIIALFVMASVYGLVGLLADTFDVGTNKTITVPALPTASK